MFSMLIVLMDCFQAPGLLVVLFARYLMALQFSSKNTALPSNGRKSVLVDKIIETFKHSAWIQEMINVSKVWIGNMENSVKTEEIQVQIPVTSPVKSTRFFNSHLVKFQVHQHTIKWMTSTTRSQPKAQAHLYQADKYQHILYLL